MIKKLCDQLMASSATLILIDFHVSLRSSETLIVSSLGYKDNAVRENVHGTNNSCAFLVSIVNSVSF